MRTNQDHYSTMSAIMAGECSTAEIVRFIEKTDAASISDDQLSQYLQAIIDTASFTFDASQQTKPVIDIAGTGGDQKHTVNISTLAALVCAATNQVKVCKYGNKSASGICGSMDVLESVGIEIDRTPDQLDVLVREQNFIPLFARTIYPGARHVAAARQLVGKPTIFNLLFALARPIKGDFSFLMGFSQLNLLHLATKLLTHTKATCLLVHGLDGTDEISVTGRGLTNYVFLQKGSTITGIIDCKKTCGIEPCELNELLIHSKADAVELFTQTLDPTFSNPRIEKIRQSVLINAAAAVGVATRENSDSLEKSLATTFPIVKKTLLSGDAQRLLLSLQEGQS